MKHPRRCHAPHLFYALLLLLPLQPQRLELRFECLLLPLLRALDLGPRRVRGERKRR
jgi:hypothetical protein